MPICHGSGPAADATAATATTPNTANASIADNLALAYFGSNIVNRTMRLSSLASSSVRLVREGLSEREIVPRAARSTPRRGRARRRQPTPKLVHATTASTLAELVA